MGASRVVKTSTSKSAVNTWTYRQPAPLFCKLCAKSHVVAVTRVVGVCLRPHAQTHAKNHIKPAFQVFLVKTCLRTTRHCKTISKRSRQFSLRFSHPQTLWMLLRPLANHWLWL